MRRLQTIVLVALLAAAGLAAADAPRWRSAILDDAAFQVRLVRDVAEIERLLGDDLDRDFILLEIDVRPLFNSNIKITRDDFRLRSYRNNQNSEAQSPDRIAGAEVLVLRDGQGGGGGAFAQQETIFLGGPPGTDGSPGGIHGPGQVGVGSGSGVPGGIGSLSNETRPEATLLERLQRLELPVGETREQVRGYLYFQVNPKHKPKHFVLGYDGSAGEYKIYFKKNKKK
jgi:hypothetical protein